MLFSDLALIPDIFDEFTYSSGEVGEIRLDQLKDVLLDEALVRNLRDGAWSALFQTERTWHPRTRELVRKLLQQNRLYGFPCSSREAPGSDAEWCHEALTAPDHLDAVITGTQVKAEFDEERVIDILRMRNSRWWQGRSTSVRLKKQMAEYLTVLRLILANANSLMFIDPHLTPTKPGYREFPTILEAAFAGRSTKPSVEIHRACWEGDGNRRNVRNDWDSVFRTAWEREFRDKGLSATVYVWDNMHDRYLISDIAGILVPYGFDTNRDPTAQTTWTRLGRNARDDIQREFDKNSTVHKLQRPGIFSVP